MRTRGNFLKACLSVPALGLLFMTATVRPIDANDSVTLKYTYRPDQTQVTLLQDGQGKQYLSLAEIAKFYGINLQFDARTQRVFLTKNKNRVKLVLSQPMFLILNPTESFPIDPVAEVDGQLAVTPATAQDLLAAILGINTRFLPEQQTLTVGGVRPDELKKEIVAQENRQTVHASPTSSNTILPAVTSTAIPSRVVNSRGEEEAAQTALSGNSRGDTTKGCHVRCIVIDAGHGGRDIGAKGYDNRYCEKQATLSIALKVVQLLKKQPGLSVLMTRNRDYFVTLKGRTQFANQHHADLFVSIHCNSAPRYKAALTSGSEIWIYSPKTTNNYAKFEASRENEEGGNEEGGGNLGFFSDLYYQTYYHRSIFVAERVSKFINERLGQHMRRIQQANFYVLGRVDMPSLLIETAFISNPKEELKLEDPEWQDKIAGSIADGILAYRDVVEGSAGIEQAQR